MKLAHMAMGIGLVAVACQSPDEEKKGGDKTIPDTGDDVTTTTTGDTATWGVSPLGSVDDLTTEGWPYARTPELISDEFVQGKTGVIGIRDSPAYAEVIVFRSKDGMGFGPCDEWGTCLDILQPETFREAVTDALGDALIEEAISETEPTDIWYMQAVVVDPVTGITGTSNVVLRHVGIPDTEAATSFVLATGALPLMDTINNRHTGGMAWVDYNNDYFADVFVSNGSGLDHYLYRNDGDGTFTDVSHLIPKPDVLLEDAGIKFADIDNDGDSDILVVVDEPEDVTLLPPLPLVHEGGPNLLYVNQGDGTFVEEAEIRGVVDPRGWRNITAGFADYDRDGWIDLYLGNWAPASEPLGVHDNFDRMLRNNGDGTFSEVDLGVTGEGRDALTSIWFDANMDDWPDLYVANIAHADDKPDYNPDDVFYINDGGVGFTDVTAGSLPVGTDNWAAMGIDIGDLDHDGDWDMYITDQWQERGVLPIGNALYLGNPDGTLSFNNCDEAGVCTGYLCWPANFADFDRDGWTDLWVGTSFDDTPDFLYINNRDGTFTWHETPGVNDNASRGGAIADYDGDGDIDFFVWNEASVSKLYRQESRDTNNWVELRLFGTASNRDAIGTILRLTAAGQTQMRRVSGGDSAHSQSELIQHFGLGDETTASLEITWPSGTVQTLELTTVNDLLFIDEDAGILAEELVETQATWDVSAGRLDVVARSNFGGRTALTVEGYGDMTWNAAPVAFESSFVEPVNPGTVRVIASRGSEWELPVVEVP